MMRFLLALWRVFFPECVMCGGSGVMTMHEPDFGEMPCTCGAFERKENGR